MDHVEKPKIRLTTVDEAAGDKRGRLLRAALELFEARGFDAVTVPEIAAHAGVAVGTVYRYFETKKVLVNAVYRHWKNRQHEMVLNNFPASSSPRVEFGHYWRRLTLFARTYPRALRFMELHHHASYLDDESRSLAQRQAQAAEAFVQRARAAGAIRPLDPALVVALMWGASAALVKFAGAGELAFDGATGAAMEETLWRGIAATESTTEEKA